jgi:hypothetical protein
LSYVFYENDEHEVSPVPQKLAQGRHRGGQGALQIYITHTQTHTLTYIYSVPTHPENGQNDIFYKKKKEASKVFPSRY